MQKFALLLFPLMLIAAGCASPEPRKEVLQPLVGKTVGEVAAALNTPEKQFSADDDDLKGCYRGVSCFMIGPPYGRILKIYVSRDDAVVTSERRVEANEFFSKRATGIEVWFWGTRRDICVGEATPHFLNSQ